MRELDTESAHQIYTQNKLYVVQYTRYTLGTVQIFYIPEAVYTAEHSIKWLY